jgi:hypothetical protein
MSCDYWLSIQEILAATRNLEEASYRITAGSVSTRDIKAGKKTSNGDLSDSIYLSDYARELLAVDRAKIEYKAGLNALRTQLELDRDALDLFA